MNLPTEEPVFPERVVLQEGYPWAFGTWPEHFEIVMRSQVKGGFNLPIDFPKVLWSEKVPKYRLVLELIEPRTEKAPSISRDTLREVLSDHEAFAAAQPDADLIVQVALEAASRSTPDEEKNSEAVRQIAKRFGVSSLK